MKSHSSDVDRRLNYLDQASWWLDLLHCQVASQLATGRPVLRAELAVAPVGLLDSSRQSVLFIALGVTALRYK
jgi:hypothetical protein